jgi:hypothetical protein
MKEDGRIFGDFLYRQSPEGRLTAYYGAGRRGLSPHDSHGLAGPG